MGRWPIRDGRPVSPYDMGYTKPTPEDDLIRGRVNIHHGAWPWSRLRDNPVSRVWGSLIINTFPMIGLEHNMGNSNLHHDFDPPKLPPLGLQAEVVDEYLALHGVIDCIYHKQTRQTYPVLEEQWQNMKKGI